jgi:hypothetical protein
MPWGDVIDGAMCQYVCSLICYIVALPSYVQEILTCHNDSQMYIALAMLHVDPWAFIETRSQPFRALQYWKNTCWNMLLSNASNDEHSLYPHLWPTFYQAALSFSYCRIRPADGVWYVETVMLVVTLYVAVHNSIFRLLMITELVAITQLMMLLLTGCAK